MTNLTPRGDLAAVELAFYSPALLIALYLLIKHGFGKSLGWIYLVTLPILRLIGNSCTLYSETHHDYSTSLLTTALITSAIGTAPLLLAHLAFERRIHTTTTAHASPSAPTVSPKIFHLAHVVGLAAFVLAIVGGTDRGSADAATARTGKSLYEAAGVLFLALWAIGAVVAALTARIGRALPGSERWLLWGVWLAVPFLLVRTIYTVARSFASAGSVFYWASPDVVVMGIMQFAMEAIVVIIYIAAGFLTPRVADRVNEEYAMDSRSGRRGPVKHRGHHQSSRPLQRLRDRGADYA